MPAPQAAPPPRAPPQPVAQALTLYAFYQGVRHPVDKEEFVIGRGQKTSDLVIRDSNVSRRHAIVIRHNNQWWIVDQQSTNGVEFNGQKVERKRIDDGDVFRICDYEILFTYQ